MATPTKAHLFKAKIRLLELGLLSEALDLELHLETGEFDTDAFDESIISSISCYVKDCEARYEESGLPLFQAKSKHCTSLKQQFINEFFSSAKSTKCPHCKAPARRIRQEHQSKLLLLGLSSKQSHQWADAVSRERSFGLDKEKDAELIGMESVDVAKSACKNNILNPLQARSHLRQLWARDGSVLVSLFSCLRGQSAIGEDQYCPTDMFFLDVIAVPPSRFRPVSYIIYM